MGLVAHMVLKASARAVCSRIGGFVEVRHTWNVAPVALNDQALASLDAAGLIRWKRSLLPATARDGNSLPILLTNLVDDFVLDVFAQPAHETDALEHLLHEFSGTQLEGLSACCCLCAIVVVAVAAAAAATCACVCVVLSMETRRRQGCHNSRTRWGWRWFGLVALLTRQGFEAEYKIDWLRTQFTKRKTEAATSGSSHLILFQKDFAELADTVLSLAPAIGHFKILDEETTILTQHLDLFAQVHAAGQGGPVATVTT